MKQARSSFLGFVLSMTTLLPFRISSSATLQHFSLVFKVSRFTLEYYGIQFFQKVDLPEAGLPTKITISFSTKSTLFPLPTITSPVQGTLVGLNPLTSILSTCPKNKFSGVLNQMHTFKANFKSESEKSLCFPSFLPAASPQKKLFSLTILTPPFSFSKHSHIFPPGLRNQSSCDAMNTCISTPISFAMFCTLVLMSCAFVCPFCIPAWLVKITILQPSFASSLILGLTLSFRKSQSQASLGNLAPLFLVMIVSSISNEAIWAEGVSPGDDPIRQVFYSVHTHSPNFLSADQSALALGGISQIEYKIPTLSAFILKFQ